MPSRKPPWKEREVPRVPEEGQQRRQRREDRKPGASPADERERKKYDSNRQRDAAPRVTTYRKEAHPERTNDKPAWRRKTDADKSPLPARTQRIEAAYRVADAKSTAGDGRGKATHWGEVAEWYDHLVGDNGNDFQREVIMPGVSRLLEHRRAQGEYLVLDLGCGQGVLGRFLAREGCRVVGIDAAEPLIAKARQRNQTDKLPISYIVADVTRLLDEAGRPRVNVQPLFFDAVTIALAIQNITPLSAVWQACHRLLKPNGKLVVVLMHPCFRVPQHADWHYDFSAKIQSRLVSKYMSSLDVEIKMHPSYIAQGKKPPVTTHFHRPLQAYINTLGNAGLYVDHMEEWTSPKQDEPGPHKAAKDAARKEIPMFLAIRARKM
ncbi:MAG: Ubiquinone biosynthesis O-methyltransferase [Firmicutes bacterium]|nr:Ubiquinone biosynthesis O-methyltransferase [candidate division NPL-UPA2 bacterium]